MQEKSGVGQSSTTRGKMGMESDQPGALLGGAAAATASSTQNAGSPGQSTVDRAKETISNVASQAGDKVASRIDTQKDKAADDIGSVAQALRQTGNQLREQDQGGAVHEYVASIANQAERLSGYLRSTNTRAIVSDVEQFARQQPALFVGGAFVLGLLGARFLKSSGQAGTGASGSVPRGRSLVPRSPMASSVEDYRYSGASVTGARAYGAQGLTTPDQRGEEF